MIRNQGKRYIAQGWEIAESVTVGTTAANNFSSGPGIVFIPGVTTPVNISLSVLKPGVQSPNIENDDQWHSKEFKGLAGGDFLNVVCRRIEGYTGTATDLIVAH